LDDVLDGRVNDNARDHDASVRSAVIDSATEVDVAFVNDGVGGGVMVGVTVPVVVGSGVSDGSVIVDSTVGDTDDV
jgi:hypothetical protein